MDDSFNDDITDLGFELDIDVTMEINALNIARTSKTSPKRCAFLEASPTIDINKRVACPSPPRRSPSPPMPLVQPATASLPPSSSSTKPTLSLFAHDQPLYPKANKHQPLPQTQPQASHLMHIVNDDDNDGEQDDFGFDVGEVTTELLTITGSSLALPQSSVSLLSPSPPIDTDDGDTNVMFECMRNNSTSSIAPNNNNNNNSIIDDSDSSNDNDDALDIADGDTLTNLMVLPTAVSSASFSLLEDDDDGQTHQGFEDITMNFVGTLQAHQQYGDDDEEAER
jgi:hypothetical protein